MAKKAVEVEKSVFVVHLGDIKVVVEAVDAQEAVEIAKKEAKTNIEEESE